MTNVTSNFSDDMRKYVVTVPPLLTTVEDVEITLPAVVFEFDTGSSTTPADAASTLQRYVDKYSPIQANHPAYLCSWFRLTTNLEEGIASAFERALVADSRNASLDVFVATTLNLDFGRDYTLFNELRLEWARHCITALLSLSSQRSTEMNEKHNYKPLRPVKLKDLRVGDVLILEDGSPVSKSSVTYKGSNFVVLRFSDGSEGMRYQSRLEIDYALAPLCLVEGKPVYPGDGPLYYKYNPSWKHNEEGVITSGVRDDELHFHGGIAFPIADATWTKPETKPETKRVPSFQVEGVDVYPGDTVYYYGENKENWGSSHVVKESGRVVQSSTGTVGKVESYVYGAEAFRLKPMLVIGDQLVPMPVRDTAEMKHGEDYYIPCMDSSAGYLTFCWINHSFDFEMRDKGLVHLNKEAASAHTKALIALSKKKG